MTTVIISDTHLTGRFEVRKFDYLQNIISSADKVIINGDFWDGYLMSFDRFCRSKWSRLFPVLRLKETVYIYGNHDRKKWCSQKACFFSCQQTDSFEIKVGGKTLLIEHGHRIAPAEDDRFPWLVKHKFLVFSFMLLRERAPLEVFGKGMLEWYHKQNKKMKAWSQKQLIEDQILVCGHSHLAELNLECSFINTGFVRYGYGQYLKIIDDKLELVEERY